MTQCNVCCKLQVVRNTGYVALLAMSGLSRKFSDFTWTLRVYIQHVNIDYGWWRYAVHKYWISLLLQSQTTSFLVHNVHKKGHNKVWNAARLSLNYLFHVVNCCQCQWLWTVWLAKFDKYATVSKCRQDSRNERPQDKLWVHWKTAHTPVNTVWKLYIAAHCIAKLLQGQVSMMPVILKHFFGW